MIRDRLPLVLLLVVLAAWAWTTWMAADAMDALAVQAIQDALAVRGFAQLREGRVSIPDLPDGARAMAVVEATGGPSRAAPVRTPYQSSMDPNAQQRLTTCEGRLESAMAELSACRGAAPPGPFVLVDDLHGDQIGLACRAELARDPSGSVHGRVLGRGWLAVGDDFVRTFDVDDPDDWRHLDEVTLAAVASEAVPGRWMLELRGGLDTGARARLGVTWYGRRAQPGPRRIGWWADAGYDLAGTDHELAAGLSVRIGG